ncbi:4'-phosphopantetheinyl transferase superfamily protein [Streptomyces sp. p1417]|uniref:4'-phosphopantetheinyl transferase superfamily protein n=1 Tax=Streptomyces typhae TaxID=2681492 RepID=A0A6L6X3G9_9ACTN|nr:4'-phosphopantetheinyl transferase superfamily protein [Streptomyces typhae]MVO88311.1 4'-phosphopantetheinyl transferase superfamily protein [Streptomyces typhae]
MSFLLAAEPVFVVETDEDPAEAVLFPEEAAYVAKAVPKRKNEFATARHCARTALGRIGLPPAPILRGDNGEPVWPAGVVGSMTHCLGYRAAVVARSGEVLSLGVDAEPAEVLKDAGVLELVSDEVERAMLSRLAAADTSVPWDRLLFSAKETVYKTWFPLTKRWLGFEEARLDIRADGTFSAEVLVDAPVVAGVALSRFSGTWLVRDGIVVTAIVMRA